MGDFDKAPQPSGRDEAIKRMGGVMPDDSTELGKKDIEQGSSFTLDDLKNKFPGYKKVVEPSDHGDIVSTCRNKIRQANKEQAENVNAEETRRAKKEGRKPKLIKPEPIKPADTTTHIDRVYKPEGDKIVITHYAYGVDTNGGNLLLVGKVEERKATDADKQAMGIETGGNAEALRWAEVAISSPEPLDKTAGDKILAAIAKAGGDSIQKNEDNIVYSKADLRAVGITIAYGAFYAVQLKGEKHYYKGRSVKG